MQYVFFKKNGSDLPHYTILQQETTTYSSFSLMSHGHVTNIAPVLSIFKDPSESKRKKCSLHRLLGLNLSRSAVKPISHLSGRFPIRCGPTLKEEADLKVAGLPKFQIFADPFQKKTPI